jgi:hypothetical protein
MKIKNLLKGIMTMLAVMLVTASFSQENAPWNDMTGQQDDAAPDSLVIGMTVPYYVEPDPVLNNLSSQYDPTSANSAQGINSIFNWSSTNGDVDFTAPSGNADAPYREVTINTTGTAIPVTVQEVNEQGCSDPTGTTEEVDVIGEPGFTVGTQDAEVCDGANQSISIESIAGDGIDGESMYYFLLDVEKRVFDSDGSTELGNSPIYTRGDTVVQVKTADATGGVVLIPDYTFTCGTNSSAEKVITKYVFDFTNNLAGNDMAGLNHHISRKGDFLSLADDGSGGKTKPDLSNTAYNGNDGYPDDESRYTWFGQGAGTITVTVYPTPSTGNIYHVPNTFEQ